MTVLPLSVIDWPVIRLVSLVVVENSSGVAPASMVISPTNLPLPGWVADTTHLRASFGERMEALHLAHAGEFRAFVLVKYSTAMSAGSRCGGVGVGTGAPGASGAVAAAVSRGRGRRRSEMNSATGKYPTCMFTSSFHSLFERNQLCGLANGWHPANPSRRSSTGITSASGMRFS